MARDYYKILLTSQSGKGKTYSARNLDRERTGFINAENKPLPFKGQFKHHARCTTYQEAWNALIEYAKNPDIDVIFFDSFSAYVEMVLKEARKTKKNFDIWNMYNDEIGKVLDMLKRIPKEIYVTAHYETLGIEGIQEKRVKVKGKEWEGLAIVTQTISPCKSYLIAGKSQRQNTTIIMKIDYECLKNFVYLLIQIMDNQQPSS